MVAFLGSTIGNLLPAQRAAFLARVRASLAGGDSLLLGTDLVKDPAVLLAAYDDAAGVTADFNKNVLAVLNTELGADFDLDAFEHVAAWDAEREWIEMRLRAATVQTVQIPGIGLTARFARRGGDAHRGVGQVPPGGRRPPSSRPRASSYGNGGPTPRAASACRSRSPRNLRATPRGRWSRCAGRVPLAAGPRPAARPPRRGRRGSWPRPRADSPSCARCSAILYSNTFMCEALHA